VDLQLSDDQELFRETTARFIDARFPLARVRELADTPVAHDPALLGEAGELGWFALFVPEEHGGGTVSGSAVRDAVIVAEILLEHFPVAVMNPHEHLQRSI